MGGTDLVRSGRFRPSEAHCHTVMPQEFRKTSVKRRAWQQYRIPGWRLRGWSLVPLDLMMRALALRYGALKWLYLTVPPVAITAVGKARAERAARHATRRVPAYRAYLQSVGRRPDVLSNVELLSQLPEMDKGSYVDAYSLSDRCLDGTIPFAGTTIDESSGSTGRPYNWVRSSGERSIAHRNISFFARYCFGDRPLVVINAFSMGAWATGINMSLGLNRIGIVKSIGPDVDKILSTLEYLGPDYRYLVCGYPPFLKHLLDEGDRQAFTWSGLELHAVVGGEGMAEELRDVLLRRFRSVYSGYGATDVEIGMAAETPASIAVRRFARDMPDLRRALFGDDSRLPMLFQYNPLMHHLEVNAHGEVLATVSRLDVLSPRIRYNVHDEGGVAPYAQVRDVLNRFGVDGSAMWLKLASAVRAGAAHEIRPLPLPFLWIYGRRDATVSIMGANIYPEDVETALYRDAEIAPLLHSFVMGPRTDAAGNPRPWVAIELSHGSETIGPAITERLRDRLAELNADYRAALSEFPAAMLPIVELYDKGLGPFAGDGGRIKQRRILPSGVEGER